MEFDLASGTAVLERTPATLHALLDGLPTSWLHGTEGPETWSPAGVLGHLVHAEGTNWIPRARVILSRTPDRMFPPFDRFAHLDPEIRRPVPDLLATFAQLRSENLATLREWNLSLAQLELVGEHPEFGPVRMRELLATWVAHDLSHLAQIARVMAKQYRVEVGPWRSYLSIMDR